MKRQICSHYLILSRRPISPSRRALSLLAGSRTSCSASLSSRCAALPGIAPSIPLYKMDGLAASGLAGAPCVREGGRGLANRLRSLRRTRERADTVGRPSALPMRHVKEGQAGRSTALPARHGLHPRSRQPDSRFVGDERILDTFRPPSDCAR
jgi:hypothetical protein